MPSCGSLAETQLRIALRYVFSFFKLVFSTARSSKSEIRPGQTRQSIGGLDSTTLVFPKDLINAFFSSSSDLSVGQSLQAPSRTGLDLSSSSSHTTVTNLDCKEASADLNMKHSSHSSTSLTIGASLASSSSYLALASS